MELRRRSGSNCDSGSRVFEQQTGNSRNFIAKTDRRFVRLFPALPDNDVQVTEQSGKFVLGEDGFFDVVGFGMDGEIIGG